MSKMIQLRHVPDELHRKLKARAAMEGLSLSDCLLQEVERLAERHSMIYGAVYHSENLSARVPPLLELYVSSAKDSDCDRRLCYY